ncbi:SOS response-associated peptidase family protein [Mucilaginibacter sp. Bleaf8]|uniref:SOS response-associated peptidase n=1 Tax=Mucilaginibacter sp. Bleaf8 TaxID=2834430 RepID=UPI001BCC2B8F|nr:SOS response-associated peptidase family protein [Mucilaginibacter sp. Bleaf8]MBS7565506.1 SOS response-associated peptidase family protein [Mucilaginibacter sp. Bleaf8]
MCYYNGQKVTRAESIRLKGIEKAIRNYKFLNVGVHNGFNYAPCAILIPSANGKDFDIVQAEWGYVPGFVKTRTEANIFRAKYTTLNFKSENLFVKENGERSMWADAAKNRRCLVLSTGIVESRHVPKIGKKGQELKETIKYPYQVSLKGQEYFFLPGLYNEWLDPEISQFVNTVAFAITEANAVMSQIHNSKKRMPSILTEELAWEWLMEKPGEERLSQIARTQIPSRLLDFCTVDRNYRRTLEATPLEYPELARIDTSFVDTEELQFNHWPAASEAAAQETEELVTVEDAERTAYNREIGRQGDLFS